MLNVIWLAFILVAVVVGGLGGKFDAMTRGVFETAESAVMKVALPLVGIMAIWLGVMRLAERSGLVTLLARALRPVLRRLFPDVPAEHPAHGAMVMNMAANMLGLGNAATPLGLRAMTLLEQLNPRPGVATNAMVTFLAINTASIQLVPTTAIAILAVAGAKAPTAIVPTAILATLIACVSGVFMSKLLARAPMFRFERYDAESAADTPTTPTVETPALPEQPKVRPLGAWRVAVLAAFGLFFAWLFVRFAFIAPSADHAQKPLALRALLAIALLAVPFLLSFFPLYAALRGVKVYEQFVEGARESFNVALKIIPYLVGMLISVRLLREAGVIDLLTRWLSPALAWLKFPAELLPMVLMRPLSGSGTQGLFVELVNRPELGADSLIARMAGTIYGSTETTFYVLAVYFGSVAIRKTRHAIIAGLTADTVAVIASVTLCRLVFA
ncbi:MAG: nucleoside recognition domain-containing protein [Chthoniobacteraceae bacterium]